MNLKKTLTKLYMNTMLSTPEGRAHLLNQIAEAEDNGESRVFDEALDQVDDPKLKKMIERHRDDEVVHGKLFHDAVVRTGVDPGPVPAELLAIDRIDRKLGGFFQKPIKDDHGVMMAYLILQVLEERAVEQFSMYEPVFRKIDPETADVFVRVIEDEKRHLKYCHAISKRYAPDEAVREKELDRLRLLEAEAHRETELNNTRYALEHNLLKGSFTRFFWKNISALGQKRKVLPFTPFASPALRAQAALA